MLNQFSRTQLIFGEEAMGKSLQTHALPFSALAESAAIL